jgi:hypothetical protein
MAISKFIFLIYDGPVRTFLHFFVLVISILSYYLFYSLLTNAAISESVLNNDVHIYIIINNFTQIQKILQL